MLAFLSIEIRVKSGFGHRLAAGVKEKGERHEHVSSCRHKSLRHGKIADEQKRKKYQKKVKTCKKHSSSLFAKVFGEREHVFGISRPSKSLGTDKNDVDIVFFDQIVHGDLGHDAVVKGD